MSYFILIIYKVAYCSECGWTLPPGPFVPPPPADDLPAYLAWRSAVDERRRMEDSRRASEDAVRQQEDAACAGRPGLADTLTQMEAPIFGPYGGPHFGPHCGLTFTPCAGILDPIVDPIFGPHAELPFWTLFLDPIVWTSIWDHSFGPHFGPGFWIPL